MILVCSNHVKDALKMIFLPHVKLINEEEAIQSSCLICNSKAKYRLFNYIHQRKNAM
ncbi:hypothetical protein ACWM35_14535 [Neobacillus sp. K501]